MECNGGPDPSFICIYRLLLILVHLPAILLLCIIDFQPAKLIFFSTKFDKVEYFKVKTIKFSSDY